MDEDHDTRGVTTIRNSPILLNVGDGSPWEWTPGQKVVASSENRQ